MYLQSPEDEKGFGHAALYSKLCGRKHGRAHKGMKAAAPVGFKHHSYAIRAIVCNENEEWEPVKRTVFCGLEKGAARGD